MHKGIPQKIQILRFIAEQGIVSVKDVNDYFFTQDKTKLILSTLYQLGLNRMWYFNVSGGLWQISDPKLYRLLKAYYPDLAGMKVGHVSFHLAPHYLELNRVRTVIEKSDKVELVKWLSERMLRALPAEERAELCPSRVPDAVFWVVTKDGGQKKFFLECERHLNSTPQRYREVFESYFWRQDARDNNVIFLCGNERIQRRLIAIESKMFLRCSAQFVTLEGLYRKYSACTQEPQAKLEPAAEAV